MPEHHVRSLEVCAMKLQHGQTRKASRRAGGQTSGSGIDRETTPQHKPAQQTRRNREDQSGDQAGDAPVHELFSSIIAKQDCKDTKQSQHADA